MTLDAKFTADEGSGTRHSRPAGRGLGPLWSKEIVGAVITSTQRWTDLEGVDNVRDLGGLPVIGGGRTRFGVAFRASTPQQATAADVESLVNVHGIRTIVDLRLPDEAAREGYGLLTSAVARIENHPIRKANSTLQDVVVPDGRTTDLGLLYQQLLAGSVESMVEIARLVADEQQQAVIFHCAAGKDRTGVVAAVLLDAVGVDPTAIEDDYALTATRAQAVRDRLIQIPAYSNLPPVAQGVFAVDGNAIRRFLEALRASYGGAAGFLLSNGMSEDELSALRQALVG